MSDHHHHHHDKGTGVQRISLDTLRLKKVSLKGRRILVLGLGESGLAMAKWAARQDVASLRVADSRAVPPNVDALRAAVPGAELVAGPFAAATFADIDLIAISPGVPVQTKEVQEAVARGVALVSEIELFAWAINVQRPRPQVLAITGSNGKTTTTTMAGDMCRWAGKCVAVAGNIGPSALDALMDAIDRNELPQVWVLELSSFQLETTSSLNPDAAVVLNVSEDHLDRYAGMNEYAAAKQRVFQGGGIQIINRDDPVVRAMASRERDIITFGSGKGKGDFDLGLIEAAGGLWIANGDERLLRISELPVAGLHNVANAMAAMALCGAIGVQVYPLLLALKNFKGLPHRVEKVAEIDSVNFYDDSKGTNVGATLAAINGLGGVGGKVVVILGGEGKGQDFLPLKGALAAHGRAVALIGRDAETIAVAIDGCAVPLQRCGDMEEAVRWCAAQARPGDAVLLSPACASFDMYRNYAQRGETFVAAVRALEGKGV
jgi:UDP-N-acetylmuramoylalanine--D-glutamate ligase